jgi:hypothetical protein
MNTAQAFSEKAIDRKSKRRDLEAELFIWLSEWLVRLLVSIC